MELGNPSNGDDQLENTDGNGASPRLHCHTEEIDSSCSTPYVSAPSSPGRGGGAGYFFSAPTSPMHFVLSSTHFSPPAASADVLDFEFEFSSRCPSPGGGGVEAGSMSSADELFFNGQIRPMKLSSHLQRPQLLAPLLDVEEEEEETGEKAEARGRDSRLRSRSVHRRARSMSPLRQSRFQWAEEEDDGHEQQEKKEREADPDMKRVAREGEEEAVTPNSGSVSSSRSSSSGRNSKRWIFLKDLLYRSKSEGRERERGGGKEKFWHAISFSPTSSRDKPKPTPPSGDLPPPPPATDVPKSRQKGGLKRAAGGAAGAKRHGPVPSPSPHERHYTANRAQAEEMRRRTFLPYRQGLLGCLGLSSRGYAAMNGLARSLQPVPSRGFEVGRAKKTASMVRRVAAPHSKIIRFYMFRTEKSRKTILLKPSKVVVSEGDSCLDC